jgi:hypothetical protein
MPAVRGTGRLSSVTRPHQRVALDSCAFSKSKPMTARGADSPPWIRRSGARSHARVVPTSRTRSALLPRAVLSPRRLAARAADRSPGAIAVSRKTLSWPPRLAAPVYEGGVAGHLNNVAEPRPLPAADWACGKSKRLATDPRGTLIGTPGSRLPCATPPQASRLTRRRAHRALVAEGCGADHGVSLRGPCRAALANP